MWEDFWEKISETLSSSCFVFRDVLVAAFALAFALAPDGEKLTLSDTTPEGILSDIRFLYDLLTICLGS